MGKRKVDDLFVKILCLVGAIALWVIIINTTNLPKRMSFNNVPVQVQNGETLKARGLILVPDQELTVRTPLEGPANDLYSINADSVSVTLDVSQRTLKAGKQEVQVTFVQTPAGVNLIGSNPTVEIELDEYVKKPVEIKKNLLEYSAAEGYYVPEPTFDSNYVTVSGPKTSVELVAAVKPTSVKKDINLMSRDVLKLEPLDADNNVVPNVTLSESYVEVTYIPQPVKEVPVTAVRAGVNPAINLTLISAEPSTVRITGRVNILKNITELETESLNMEEIEPGETTHSKSLVLPDDILVLDANNNVEDGIVDVVTVAEPIMTKVVTKNVTLVGQPLVGRISELPLPVAVTISGTKTKLDELNDNLILMTADVEGLDLGSHQVPVKVDVPQEYTFIKTVPDTIEVVVEP